MQHGAGNQTQIPTQAAHTRNSLPVSPALGASFLTRATEVYMQISVCQPCSAPPVYSARETPGTISTKLQGEAKAKGITACVTFTFFSCSIMVCGEVGFTHSAPFLFVFDFVFK